MASASLRPRLGGGGGEPLEDGTPAPTGFDDLVVQDLALDEPVDVTVLELDCGLVGPVSVEADFDLAGVLGSSSNCQWPLICQVTTTRRGGS
jgi:hypothetical protein